MQEPTLTVAQRDALIWLSKHNGEGNILKDGTVLLVNGARVEQADPHFLRLAELMDQQSRDAITREHQWQEALLNVIKELKPH